VKIYSRVLTVNRQNCKTFIFYCQRRAFTIGRSLRAPRQVLHISRVAVAPLSPYGAPNNARCSSNEIRGLCSSSQPRRVQSTTLSACFTQHIWGLLAGIRTAVLSRHYAGKASYGYAMLMNLNKGETAVRGCHCPGDIAMRLREEVLARPWVGVCVPLAFGFSYIQDAKPHHDSITCVRNSFQRIFVF